MDTPFENGDPKIITRVEEKEIINVFWLFVRMIIQFIVVYSVLVLYYHYNPSKQSDNDDSEVYSCTSASSCQQLTIQIEDCCFCTYTEDCSCCRGTHCTKNTGRFQ